MSPFKPLKQIMAELALEFGVTKKMIWNVVTRASGGFGAGWKTKPYVRRPATAEEVTKFRLPARSEVLHGQGDRRPTFFVFPTSEKGEDGIVRPSVDASAYGLMYIASICIRGKDAHLP